LAHGWELHIDGVGVTQSHNLTTAEDMVRDYIALDLGVDPESFDVAITPEAGDGLDEDVAAVRRKIREAEQRSCWPPNVRERLSASSQPKDFPARISRKF
jgi:hypothetical protein